MKNYCFVFLKRLQDKEGLNINCGLKETFGDTGTADRAVEMEDIQFSVTLSLHSLASLS